MSHASGTVVDSSVLLDVFTMDTAWGDWSQLQLTRAAQRGALILNAVEAGFARRNSWWAEPG